MATCPFEEGDWVKRRWGIWAWLMVGEPGGGPWEVTRVVASGGFSIAGRSGYLAHEARYFKRVGAPNV